MGRRERGISLIIAMVMLAVLGLASAAIMRNAVSADQVVTNNRLLTQANQSAQLALRFCENQLALPVSARSITPFPAQPNGAWTARADWTSGGPTMAHTLVAADISSAIQPRVAPQCMVEATAAADVFTVTARGFSPDFVADANSGATRSGSVVWLQSTLLLAEAGGAQAHDTSAQPDDAPASSAPPAPGPTAATACATDCPTAIRQRVWQQLLTPPF